MPAHFHHVPGRLRVHVPGVKGSTGNAQVVERSLSNLKGVSRVETRTLTGSVVVHYDAAALDASALFAALNVRADFSQASALHPAGFSPARSNQIAAKAVKVVAGYALEKALERGIPLLLGALL
ncbi:MAG TPA: cation transporter [Bryobacteraceae bacterium]|nr:cation transporter [Bryobacteraceae bacterium]